MPTAPGSGEMPVRTTDGNEGGIGTGVRWRPVSAAASLAGDRAWGQRTRPPTHGRGRTAPAGTPGTGAQRRRRRHRPPQPCGRTGEASRAEGHGCLTVSSVRGLRALESRERAGVVVPGLGVGRGGRRCRAKGGACARGQSRGARKPDACCAGSMAVLGTARRTRGGVRPARRACEGPWEPARRRKPLLQARAPPVTPPAGPPHGLYFKNTNK